MIATVKQFIAQLVPGETATRQLARGSLISFAIQGSGAGLIFLSEILLARILGAADYGLFATVSAWLQVLLVVALLGSNNLLLRFVPTYVTAMDWALLRGVMAYSGRVSLAVGAAIFVFTVVLMAVFESHLSAETRWSFLIGMAALPVVALSIQRQAVLRGLHRVAVALTPELIVRPAGLILLVSALYWVLGISVSAPHALAVNGLAALFAFLLGRYWQQQAMPGDARSAPIAMRADEWLRMAMPLALIAGMQLLIVRMDIMLLVALAGHEQAGHYAAASRIADLVVFALAAANVIVAPLIAGLHARNDIAGMQRMLAALAKGVALLTIPLVVLIGILGRPVLGLFGEGYEVAYLPLLLLVCGQVVNALSGPVDFIMAMTGQQMKMLQILALATALNLALNLLLIPLLGLLGAAIATASTTIFWNLFMRCAIRGRLGVEASVLVLLRKQA